MNKMWKRSLSLFLAIVMIVGIIPMNVFATEQECAHENVEYIDEPATCVWEGYYAEYCNDCQQYLVEEILGAAGHDWADGVCTVCGEAEEVEPEAEEPAETPDAEIPEEEPSVEETPAEDEAEELISVEAPVAYTATREENGVILHGNNVFLDKSRDNDLMTSVMKGGLKDMVLDALNTTGDKVYYVSGGSKYDVTSLTDLAAMYEELKDVLTGQAALRFQVVKGGSVVKDEYVTLRNIAHLQFDIEIPVVESKGEPADLKAAVQNALDNAVITVTHGGDVIDHEMMSGKLFKVEEIFPEDLEGQWPAKTKSVESDFGLKVSIFDSVDQTTVESATVYVRLQDTTPTYTVTFNSNGAAWKQYKVIEGEELPVAVSSLKPTRLYYTFTGWDKTVETTVTADAVYEAQWDITDGYDMNGNGKPDPTESFTVQFLLDEDAAEPYYSESVKYGAKTPVPANPDKPSYAEEGKEYIFLGWKPLNNDDRDAVVAATVTDHATYVAKWEEAAGQAVITFNKNRVTATEEDGTDTWTETTDINGVLAEAPMDYSGANREWTGWYVADANGDATTYKYDFAKTIEEQSDAIAAAGGVVDGNKISLVGTLGVDAGGLEGVIDGTEDDPYTKYVFQWLNDGVWADLFKPAADYLYDESTRVDLTDLETYFDPADDRNNDQLHIGWAEVTTSTVYSVREFKADYSKTVYLRPVYADDYNNNDVDDALESAKIAVNNDTLGSYEIPNHTVTDGKFLANTNGDTLGKNGYETEIIATPAKGANSYVSKILINGVEQELNIADDGSVTIALHEADLSGAKGTEVVYDIQVVFETMEIKFKAEPDAGVLIPGKTYTEADMAAVYDAVVESPERGEAKVNVEYVARKAENGVTVSVAALRKDIELRYSKLASKILDKVWPGDTVTVDLTEVTLPIHEQPEGMVKTPQQVADSYILELQGADIAELLGVLATLDLTIQARVRESANIRPFLYNANGSEFEETLVVNYVGNKQDLTNRKTYTIADSRTLPTITASAKTVTIGEFTDADLLKGVSISPAAGEVKLDGSYEKAFARTYNGVGVYFEGNEAYKPASAKFNLTIQKAKLSGFSVEKAIVEPVGQDYAHRADPNFGAGDPDDVDYIAMVAGLDLNDIDIDLSSNKPIVNLKNMKAKAWIDLPDYLKSALEILGVDTSASAKRTLDEVETMFENHKDALIQLNVPEKAVNAMMKVLRKVNEYAAADAELEIVFAEDVYPSNPGVYVNLAVVADPRFETEIALGSIMIAPVVALPDRGDVQLSYNGSIENVFTFDCDGTPKALDVLYKGSKVDADVFYFGLNTKLAVHSGTAASDVPELPGIYLASTVYVAEDANGDISRLGSDVALVVIGLKDVSLDIVSEVIEEDGEAHRPEIKVSATDAALTIISGEVMVEADGDINLDDVKSTVNIEFPALVHELWKDFFKTLNAQDKVNLPKVNENLAECVITPDTLVRFLNWCEDRLNGNLLEEDVVNAIEKLEKLQIPADKIDAVVTNYQKMLDKLQAAADKIVTAAEKAENNLNEEVFKITFEPNKSYTKNGVYYYFGVVTDPDYIPAANGGVMIIKAPDDAMVLLDTHVPYNGTGKEPVGWDTTGREGITMIVDKNESDYGITFVVDNTMKNAFNKFKDATGIDLMNGEHTVSDLYVGGKSYVSELVDQIVDSKYAEIIKDKADSEVAQLLAGALTPFVAAMRSQLEDELNAALDKARNCDHKLENCNHRISIVDKTATGYLPVDVGTYEFYAYSYAIEVAKATLYIEPIYVRVAAQDNTKVYDGLDGLEGVTDKKDPVVSYYSYEYVEGETREDNEVAIDYVSKLGVTVTGLDLKYDTTCTGTNVGTYPIEISNATISDTYDFMAPTVDTENAELTITERVIKVKAANVEKFYLDADPTFDYEVVEGTIVEGDELEFSVKRADNDENVGAHNLVIEMTKDNANYIVELVEGGVLTIKPAVITVIAENVEKQFDAEDPEFNYTYVVEAGLGTYKLEDGTFDDAKVRELLDNAPLSVNVARKDPKPENEAVGDTAVLVVNHGESDNVTIKTVEGTLTVGLGDYVCWNMQTGVYYDDLSEALEDVDGAEVETVQMLKDFTETDYIIIAPGTTLDLDIYTVTAENFVVGFDGSYLDGNVFDIDGAYGKLITRKSFAMLTDGAFVDEKGYSILPIYYNGGTPDDTSDDGYVFTRMEVNTNNASRGLTIDQANDKMHFQFVTNMTGDVRTKIMHDGADGNNVSIVIRLEWEVVGGDDIAYQDFVYNDALIASICGGGRDFTFDMSGYSALNIDLSTLVVKGIVKTDCGAVEYGVEWTAPVSTEETN